MACNYPEHTCEQERKAPIAPSSEWFKGCKLPGLSLLSNQFYKTTVQTLGDCHSGKKDATQGLERKLLSQTPPHVAKKGF